MEGHQTQGGSKVAARQKHPDENNHVYDDHDQEQV